MVALILIARKMFGRFETRLDTMVWLSDSNEGRLLFFCLAKVLRQTIVVGRQTTMIHSCFPFPWVVWVVWVLDQT